MPGRAAPWKSGDRVREAARDAQARGRRPARRRHPVALTGGVAIWAYGGPETEHDLDFFVKPEDAERALQALVEQGFRPEKPPEGWLYKAWDGDVLVDLIFETAGTLGRRRADAAWRPSSR